MQDDLLFILRADASDFVSGLSDAQRASLGLDAARQRLARSGVRTRNEFIREIQVLDDLMERHKRDAIYTEQLRRRKEALVYTMNNLASGSQGVVRGSSAMQNSIVSLGYVLNDAQQFTFGFAEGIRAVANNIPSLVAGVVRSTAALNAIIIVLNLAALAAVVFGDKISAAFGRTAAKAAEMSEKIKEALNIISVEREYFLTASQLPSIIQRHKDELYFLERYGELLTNEAVSLNNLVFDRDLGKTVNKQEALNRARATAYKALGEGVTLESKILDLKAQQLRLEEDQAALEERRNSERLAAGIEETQQNEQAYQAYLKQLKAKDKGADISREQFLLLMEEGRLQEHLLQIGQKRGEAQKTILGTTMEQVAALQAELALRQGSQGLLLAQLEYEIVSLEESLRLNKFITQELLLQARLRARYGDAAMPEPLPPMGVEAAPAVGKPTSRHLREITAESLRALEKGIKDADDALFASTDALVARANQIAATIEDGLRNIALSLAAGIGEIIAGAGGFDELGVVLLESLGRFSQELGESLIVFGNLGVLLKNAIISFITNPYLVVLAGLGFVALGAALQKSASRMAKKYAETGSATGDGPGAFNFGVGGMLGGSVSYAQASAGASLPYVGAAPHAAGADLTEAVAAGVSRVLRAATPAEVVALVRRTEASLVRSGAAHPLGRGV